MEILNNSLSVPVADCAALIPAAGMGKRLGLGPKGLLMIGERTLVEILAHTLKPLVNTVVVATPPGYESAFRCLLGPDFQVIPGGHSRQESIERMMYACPEDILLIQDVARPFASASTMQATLDAACEHGAAGAFLDPMVPVGYLDAGLVGQEWNRDHARLFQAPQAYRREVLEQSGKITAGMHFQSTAQMVIAAGFTLAAIPGASENIKITTPFDWLVAQRVIAPYLNLI